MKSAGKLVSGQALVGSAGRHVTGQAMVKSVGKQVASQAIVESGKTCNQSIVKSAGHM